MKKVLIISYYFPPDPAIGGLRIQGLAKYLPEFGWEPIILTKKLTGLPDFQTRILQTHLLEYDVGVSLKKKFRLNHNTAIKSSRSPTNKNKTSFTYRFLYFIFYDIIAYPDNHKGWYDCAINVGDELIENEKIDAIISSSSPIICHIIANCLKMKYNIPWIADLRDLWSQNHYNQFSIIRKCWEKRLEIKTLSNAEVLTTVSEYLSDKLQLLHKGKAIHSIPNGFDPQYMTNVQSGVTNKFTITYTGNLYKGKRDPSKLFMALCELINEKKMNADNIDVRFYGPNEYWLDSDIEKYGLKEIVNYHGLIPRNLALKKQNESQLLLLLLWDHPEEIGVFTGKIFEYLAAQRPILAIGGQKGVVKDLLDETSAGEYATSVDDIKKILIRCYDEYKLNGNVSYKGNEEKINNYSQREMARKFAMVLNNITKKNS